MKINTFFNKLEVVISDMYKTTDKQNIIMKKVRKIESEHNIFINGVFYSHNGRTYKDGYYSYKFLESMHKPKEQKTMVSLLVNFGKV